MELYEWQKEAIAKLKNKNGLLCVPVGEGKTLVAKEWADLDNAKSVIFTAPIKALSNERYFDLLDMGYNVGLITGDCVINPNAPILCMTQEIYTQRYAEFENQKVIFDEIGYIGKDLDRQETYFEGLAKTPKTSKILCMSATIGNIPELKKWLEKAKNDEFEVYQNVSRKKDIEVHKNFDEYDEQFKPNSLIFDFSVNRCNEIAENITNDRLNSLGLDLKDYDFDSLLNQEGILETDKNRLEKIKELAIICGVYKTNDDSKQSLVNDDLTLTAWGEQIIAGVSVYYGKLEFNEKIFIETAMKLGLIDTIVGTDALSLGVNFPCENVYIMSDTKMNELLTNNEITQMAGRAGRGEQYTQGNLFLSADFDIDVPSFISDFPIDDLKLINYTMTQNTEEIDWEKELDLALNVHTIEDFLLEIYSATTYGYDDDEYSCYDEFIDKYDLNPYEFKFKNREMYEELCLVREKGNNSREYEEFIYSYEYDLKSLQAFVDRLNSQHYGMPELKSKDDNSVSINYFNEQIELLKKLQKNDFTDFEQLVDFYNSAYKLYGEFYYSSGNKYNLMDAINSENSFYRGSYGEVEGIESDLIENENYKWAFEHKDELIKYFENVLGPVVDFCKAKILENEEKKKQEYKKILVKYISKEISNLSVIDLDNPYLSLMKHLINKENNVEKYEGAAEILDNVYDFIKKCEKEKNCMLNKKELFFKAIEKAIEAEQDYIEIGNNKINFKNIPCSNLIELDNMIIDIKSGKMVEFNEQNKDEIINKIINEVSI